MVIGIYPRKSVYRDNSDSVQVQVQLCREYAGIIFKGKDLEFRIYDKDEGFSGKNMNRPSFKELMADIEAGELDAVVVYKLDRISRNVREFSAMYEIFQQHDVAFVSVKESFDTSTPMGRTVMYILAAFAQLERENTSERVADSMLSLGIAGKWTGGKLPAGMTSIRQKVGAKEHSYLMVDPETIFRVKLLYDLLLQGNTITKVERYCRDHGIRSQSGKFLNTSQIHGIVTNPVYCQNSEEAYEYFSALGCQLPDRALFDGNHGLIGYGKTKTGAVSQKRQSASNWSIAIGIHEPVIPSGDWIAAQKRLGINKMYHTPKYEIGILKGVLHCKCGAKMDVRTYQQNGNLFSYYLCKTMVRQGRGACNSEYVRVDQIDAAFLRELQKLRLNPSGIRIRKESSHAPDVDSIQAEIRSTQKSIDNLTSALMQAMETPAAAYIIAQIGELDKQKRSLESSLRQARKLQLESNAAKETEDIIFRDICYLLDNFDQISYTGKNDLIRKIVKNCIYDGESLRIIF